MRQFKIGEKRPQWVQYVGIFAIIIVAAVIGYIIWPSSSTVSSTQSTEPQITLDQALDAMIRYHRADKICYDTKLDGFFIHYVKHDPKEGQEEDYWQGWFYLHQYQFYHSQNGTWFLADNDLPATKYAKVSPNVDGLTCKEQEIDADGKRKIPVE